MSNFVTNIFITETKFINKFSHFTRSDEITNYFMPNSKFSQFVYHQFKIIYTEIEKALPFLSQNFYLFTLQQQISIKLNYKFEFIVVERKQKEIQFIHQFPHVN